MERDYLSTLKFINYLVTELSYKQNERFSFDTEELDVDFKAQARVQLLKKAGEAAVTLKVECGDAENVFCPFLITVEVIGVFKFEGSLEDFETLATTNAISILFPYIRSLVSDLSSRSNVYPHYKLPLINVVAFLEDKDGIEVSII